MFLYRVAIYQWTMTTCLSTDKTWHCIKAIGQFHCWFTKRTVSQCTNTTKVKLEQSVLHYNPQQLFITDQYRQETHNNLASAAVCQVRFGRRKKKQWIMLWLQRATHGTVNLKKPINVVSCLSLSHTHPPIPQHTIFLSRPSSPTHTLSLTLEQ